MVANYPTFPEPFQNSQRTEYVIVSEDSETMLYCYQGAYFNRGNSTLNFRKYALSSDSWVQQQQMISDYSTFEYNFPGYDLNFIWTSADIYENGQLLFKHTTAPQSHIGQTITSDTMYNDMLNPISIIIPTLLIVVVACLAFRNGIKGLIDTLRGR